MVAAWVLCSHHVLWLWKIDCSLLIDKVLYNERVTAVMAEWVFIDDDKRVSALWRQSECSMMTMGVNDDKASALWWQNMSSMTTEYFVMMTLLVFCDYRVTAFRMPEWVLSVGKNECFVVIFSLPKELMFYDNRDNCFQRWQSWLIWHTEFSVMRVNVLWWVLWKITECFVIIEWVLYGDSGCSMVTEWVLCDGNTVSVLLLQSEFTEMTVNAPWWHSDYYVMIEWLLYNDNRLIGFPGQSECCMTAELVL